MVRTRETSEWAKELSKVFAMRLKELRKISGLSQSELAKKLGVSRENISYYENQKRTPNIIFLGAVSTFFGVSYNYLLGYSNEKIDGKGE